MWLWYANDFWHGILFSVTILGSSVKVEFCSLKFSNKPFNPRSRHITNRRRRWIILTRSLVKYKLDIGITRKLILTLLTMLPTKLKKNQSTRYSVSYLKIVDTFLSNLVQKPNCSHPSSSHYVCHLHGWNHLTSKTIWRHITMRIRQSP